MNPRFLVIKQAYIEDALKRDSIHQDIESLVSLITHIYPDAHIDTCAVTEEYEWLIHGRTVNSKSQIPTYTAVYICMHSADTTYNTTYHAARAHAVRLTCLYNATDILFHHAEKLAEVIALHGDVSAIRVKVPHQIHVDIEALNAEYVSSEQIAGKHMRSLFLPIHVMESQSHDYIKRKNTQASIEQKKLAYNFEEFVQHIDSTRHTGKKLTFREYIKSPEVYVVSIPDFRNEAIYSSLGFIHKEVNGRTNWYVHHMSPIHQQEVKDVVAHISKILFTRQIVVYALSVHPRRGVFVQYTIPLLHFALQYPTFLTTVAVESGIPATDLFLRL